ncbi:hypothetical protein BH20ACT3_BH20ACT3_02660 [soil metagenome]
MNSGWVIGLGVGTLIVVVVVVLLLLMIRGATRAAEKAEAILAALHDARDNTEGMWRLDTTNRTAGRIVEAAAKARRHLATGGSRP